jgi:hypothetical protein
MGGGAGLWFEGSDLDIQDCDFSGNMAYQVRAWGDLVGLIRDGWGASVAREWCLRRRSWCHPSPSSSSWSCLVVVVVVVVVIIIIIIVVVVADFGRCRAGAGPSTQPPSAPASRPRASTRTPLW